MRIQHNIMAMSAYRNYNNNTAALSKNLEKLSSGYKINRAGDDAAGLAISEKMRAQITGLDAAQKNVKDGISLVKTAEGAMQEIQDMLNRMDYLATQSANGTYDNEVDRAALQKEVEQLKSEINRIADSANFNGIKLLDGSLAGNGTPKTINGIDRIIATVAGSTDGAPEVGTKTFLDGDPASDGKQTEFTINFSDLVAKADAAGGGGAGTPATNPTADVTFADLGTATWQDSDTFDVTTTGGTINLNLTFTRTGGAWTVTDNGTGGNALPAGWTAAFDEATGKVTLTNGTAGPLAGGDPGFGNASASNVVNANDNTLTSAAGGAVNFTDGAAATGGGGAGAGGAITGTVTLNGTDLAANVALAADDDAAAIATKVFNALTTAGSTNTAGDAAPANSKEVTVNGVDYWVTDDTKGTLTFKMKDIQTDPAKVAGNFTWDVTITGGKYEGSHTAGTNVVTPGEAKTPGIRANTVFEMTLADIKDGTKITIDDKTITLAVGPNSTVADGEGVVKLNTTEAADLNLALSKISEALGGETKNFEVSVNRGVGDAKTGLAIYKKADSGETYDTKEKLAGVFSISTTTEVKGAKPLTLQIGDTSDDYNKLAVNVGDMHTSAMGIAGLNIGTQDGASAAIQTIRNAINYVSGVRGDLGATQNRLEHTQNNLSVMAENIQDAESTIRDTDVAEEMMSYVKNNILVQSAQAMLAQANQVPQGVLQLLG